MRSDQARATRTDELNLPGRSVHFLPHEP
jgi:hypothetical protein